MNNPTFIVTGTDTHIGKTVFSAMLTRALNGVYWKPIQSGTVPGEKTDTESVRSWSQLPNDHFLKENFVLQAAVSPHLAAELEGVKIEKEDLYLPDPSLLEGKTLIVEGAGGVLVPINRNLLQVDVFQSWTLSRLDVSAILCARTSLGTINHTLSGIEILRNHGVKVLGIVFIGDENLDSEETIVSFSGVKRLGRLPILETIDAESLDQVFAENFSLEDFMPSFVLPSLRVDHHANSDSAEDLSRSS